MDGDHRRHARRHLADVLDPHDDEPALDKAGAARVHDRDARPVALDRRLDALVPDGVAGKVEIVEHEAADRAEELRHPAGAVARGRASQRDPVPLERVVDRARVEGERAKRLLVLGLAEDGHVPRQELLGARVEVVAVAVRDEDGVEPADHLLRRERQRHGGVPDRVRRLLDRRPGARVVEHRVDEDPLAAELEEHGRATHQPEPHEAVLHDRSRAFRRANGWLYSAIRWRTTPLRSR
jgi:hypothetical protein